MICYKLWRRNEIVLNVNKISFVVARDLIKYGDYEVIL